MEMEKRKKFSLRYSRYGAEGYIWVQGGWGCGGLAGLAQWGHSRSVLLGKCYLADHVEKNKCVGLWRGWGGGILWFLVGKLEETNHLKFVSIDGRKIVNGYARNDLEFGLGFLLAWRLVSGPFEKHYESLGCRKCVELLDCLRYCLFFSKDSASWSYWLFCLSSQMVLHD